MTTQLEKSPVSTATRSRYVMAGGVRTHYTEAGGDGPVVICNHGGGAGSSGDAGMGGLLPELAAKGFRAIAIDAVGGFGLTDPSAPTPYGVQSRVAHLEDFVAALGLDKFTIVGNSQGAWVAAKYAIQHPDQIVGLVIIGSATIGGAMGIPEEPTEAFMALAKYDYTRRA
jgi:pimeloyl-ACP methyl ester carboxylesterase